MQPNMYIDSEMMRFGKIFFFPRKVVIIQNKSISEDFEQIILLVSTDSILPHKFYIQRKKKEGFTGGKYRND